MLDVPPERDDLPGAPLGDELELLLDQLVRAGLQVSPRDRVLAASLVADLVARGQARQFFELRPSLAPLLARSPAERERFFQVFDLLAPQQALDMPDIDELADDTQSELVGPRKWWPAVAAVLVLAGAMLAWWAWPTAPPPEPARPNADRSTLTVEPSTTAPTAAPATTANDTLDRIAEAAERYEGAPTIEELSRELAKNSPIGWAASSYAIRFNELSGLPKTWPLALYGKNAKDGRIWAMLALALDRIERPGREPTFAELYATANESLREVEGQVYRLSQQIPDLLQRVSALHATVTGGSGVNVRAQPGVSNPIVGVLRGGQSVLIGTCSPVNDVEWCQVRLGTSTSGWVAASFLRIEGGPGLDGRFSLEGLRIAEFERRSGRREFTPGDLVDRQTLQRALAINDEFAFRVPIDGAAWLPPPSPSGAPWWAPWLAMLVPLALAMLWLANSLTMRKAYLRRRPPDLPPLYHDIVANAATQVRFAAGLFQRIAQRLGVRTPRQTDRLDLEASIAATINDGGEIPLAVYETVRRAPEFLVLIEQRAAGDQDTQRLRDLVRRLEALLPLTVYFYRTEPSRLEPEGGGRSVSIEQLQAQYPDHRLIVLGSGAEFLDPAGLKPFASAEKLTHWPQRALLTPLPLAEWGQEEFALANALQMPIGRATPEGLLALADLLGLDGAEPDTLLDTRGDGLARPLPEMLRVRPQRFLYSAPPSGVPVESIVRDLRNFLDGPGFEWLCALAVYPAVQWDLTLYLGVSLPETPGGDVKRAQLYSEERVAALTQLPWLREGLMPNWLRVALIDELDAGRAGEIRNVLKGVLDKARLGAETHIDEAIKLRIAQEAKDRVPPDALMQDEVLLDFLARGRIEDFALPHASWLERFLPKGWFDRIGIPELAAGLVAVAYAVAAYWLTPGAGDGALPVGVWLSPVLLLLGAVAALAIADPGTAYRVVRTALLRAAPVALAFATTLVIAVGADWLTRPERMLRLFFASSLAGFTALSVLVVGQMGLAVAVWSMARWLCGRLGIPVRGSAATGWSAFALRLPMASLLHLMSLAVVTIAGPLFSSDPASQTLSGLTSVGSLIAVCLGVFAIAVAFARMLPEQLTPPRAIEADAQPQRWRAAVRPGLALLPILPAVALAYVVAQSSVELERIPGGATAVAELQGGGMIALGGADGIVRVYDAPKRTRRPIREIQLNAPVSSLALRRERDSDPASPVALLASTSDGRVHLHDARSGARRPDKLDIATLRGEGSKVHVILIDGAIPLIAFERADGLVNLVFEKEHMGFRDGGPVTALASGNAQSFVLAFLDGQTWMSTDGNEPGPLGDAMRLPGRARSVRIEATGQILLGDDGTTIVRQGRATRRTQNPQLALGPVVAWQRPERGGAPPPLPEPGSPDEKVAIPADRLQAFAPRIAPVYRDAFLAGTADLDAAGITAGPLRFCHFMAQIGYESGRLTIFTESLDYRTTARLMQVWPSQFPNVEAAQPFVGNPEALANRVYGNRFGNTDPGDGWRYRGRGPLQLTGRSNYRTMGQRIGAPLEQNPELALDPRYLLKIVAAFWSAQQLEGERGLNALADDNKLEAITMRVSGGYAGLDDRRQSFADCWQRWGSGPAPEAVREGAPLERGDRGLAVALLNAQLAVRKLPGIEARSLAYTRETYEAVRAFQAGAGLPVTGVATADVQAALATGAGGGLREPAPAQVGDSRPSAPARFSEASGFSRLLGHWTLSVSGRDYCADHLSGKLGALSRAEASNSGLIEIRQDGVFWSWTVQECPIVGELAANGNSYSFRAICDFKGDKYPSPVNIELLTPQSMTMSLGSSGVAFSEKNTYTKCSRLPPQQAVQPKAPPVAQPTAPIPQSAPSGSVLPSGAVLFAVQNIGFIRDRDQIRVGANLGQFDRIQLRVLGNDVFINELDVVYVNGTTQKLVLNTDVKQNTRSRWHDITGTNFIKEINIRYRSRPGISGQARIEAYGQIAEGWLGPSGRGRQFNESWVLLSAQTAGRFLRAETDVLPVSRNEGQFRRIRVTVKDRALVFDELRLVYVNGEEEVIPVKTTVAANSTFGPVDLKGGNRAIREIRTRYRSAIIDAKAVGRGASIIEVWAQH